MDYHKEIKWRKEFAILTPMFMVIGVLLCSVISIITWENMQYNILLYVTRESYILMSCLLGGYMFFSALSGIMFTAHALSKTGTGTKILLTIFFVVPLFLTTSSIFYSIPYYIYNMVRLITLKYKSKNLPNVGQAGQYNYAVNANNIPVGSNYGSYSGAYNVKNNVQQSYTASRSRVNSPNERSFVNSYVENNSLTQVSNNSTVKSEEPVNASKNCCNSVSTENMEIYEKPYEKPSEKFIQSPEEHMDEKINEKAEDLPTTPNQQQLPKEEQPMKMPMPERIINIVTVRNPDDPYGDGF